MPKESGISLTNIKQNLEPKLNLAGGARQANITQAFETTSANIIDNIIQRARLYIEGNKSAIKLHLNPPELGSLKIEFEVVDEQLEAKILVERSIVKDIIERDLPRLREQIANADIDLGKFDVFLQEKGDERFSFMNRDFLSDLGKDRQAQDFANQDDGDFDGSADEDLVLSGSNSNKINYLV